MLKGFNLTVSYILFSSLPVLAQNGSDVTIRTVAPVEQSGAANSILSQQPIVTRSRSAGGYSALTFTPEAEPAPSPAAVSPGDNNAVSSPQFAPPLRGPVGTAGINSGYGGAAARTAPNMVPSAASSSVNGFDADPSVSRSQLPAAPDPGSGLVPNAVSSPIASPASQSENNSGRGPVSSGFPGVQPESGASSVGANGPPSLQKSSPEVAGANATQPRALAAAEPDSGKVEAARNGADQLSQLPGMSRRRSNLPNVMGTVKIRRPFKLFATEQLVHFMSFRDTPVREVIAEIARRGNLNILIDRSVIGKITGELRDVTLNEAMDSVLASAGLQSRILDNNTVVVATTQAMVQLGLNRPLARVFKLSYAHPYDIAMILHASVFNRGALPDFSKTAERTQTNSSVQQSTTETRREGGGPQAQGTTDEKFTQQSQEGPNSVSDSERNTQITRLDQQRIVRGASREQTQEGVGFNNAATDPGSQQIRAFQEINTDYIVEQNGGGAVVVPDVKNRQVLVVGTQEDLAVAEEAIRMLDRRPGQVHIQASLIELSNQGIRQLGATLNVQGGGLSGSVLGNSSAPLVQYLPGLGSPGPLVNSQAAFTNGAFPFGRLNLLGSGVPPPLIPFINEGLSQQRFENTSAASVSSPVLTNVTPSTPGTAFAGLIGSLLPTPPTIAGIAASPAAQSGFNFLTLSKEAGGKLNIATLPSALGINLNLLLQTNKAKIIANPSVVVTDNTEALITIANEVIHKVTATVSLGVVSTNVELTKAGVFLNCLPKIAEDGFVTLRLRPQVSAPLGPPQQFPGGTIVTLLSVREIMSQEVRIKDGQTLVLGGLFTEQEAAQMAKVPYLAETPILGALFRNTLKGRSRTELVLLLTPKVVEEEPPAISESQPPVQM